VTVTVDAYVLLNSAQPGHRCFQQSEPSSTILPADWLKQFVTDLTRTVTEVVLPFYCWRWEWLGVKQQRS
jgi:hypothetical protein